MIRSALGCGGAALLAACSAGQPDPAVPIDESAVAVPAGQAATAGNAAGAAAGLPAKAGGRMTAQVSALTGEMSGLNTRITDQGLVIDLPADALFEFDKAALTTAAEGELRKAAELIRSSPPGSVQVIGHTDSLGEDAYNQQLSEARARSVADWFGQQVGVRQRAFAVSGKGETAPIAPNADTDGSDDPAGRARNRRVEVIVPNG